MSAQRLRIRMKVTEKLIRNGDLPDLARHIFPTGDHFRSTDLRRTITSRRICDPQIGPGPAPGRIHPLPVKTSMDQDRIAGLASRAAAETVRSGLPAEPSALSLPAGETW